ncbi:MAG: hypothetical protein LQ346_004016 [Caloplaca aetnensis]|nr:MAG: hypothetical protein LQ346_004016 [Caloplaca aetnensis]
MSDFLRNSSLAEFVEMLREKSEEYDRILYFLGTHERENFAVLGSGANKFYLAPWTLALLHHRPQGLLQSKADTDPSLRQLYYRPFEGSDEVPFEPINGTPSSFLPLGYLVLADVHGEPGRLTQYAWALNLSSKPIALWLLFDYMSVDFEGNECAIDLHDIYADESWGGIQGMTHKGEQPAGQNGSIRNMLGHYDSIKVLDNIDGWHIDKVVEQPSGSTKPQILGQSLRAYPSSDLFFLRRLQALRKAKRDGGMET